MHNKRNNLQLADLDKVQEEHQAIYLIMEIKDQIVAKQPSIKGLRWIKIINSLALIINQKLR